MHSATIIKVSKCDQEKNTITQLAESINDKLAIELGSESMKKYEQSLWEGFEERNIENYYITS